MNRKTLGTLATLALVFAVPGLDPGFPAQASPNIPPLQHTAVFTIGSTTVLVDGRPYTMDVAPYIDKDGRTMLPVRYEADVLDMTPAWDGQTRMATLSSNRFDAKVELKVGSNSMLWENVYAEKYIGAANGEEFMDTVPVIVPPGRVMLPALFVADAVGYRVNWNGSNRTVTIVNTGRRAPLFQ